MRSEIITSYTTAGEYMRSRFLNGVSLAESTGAPNLKLPRHSHRLAGFSLVLQGGYTESYGQTLLECTASSVKFHPAGEAHADSYGNKAVHNFIIELEPAWLTATGASALVGDSPVLFSDNSISWLMLKLRKEFRSMDAEAPLVIEGLTLELIAEASRSLKKKVEGEGPHWLGQAKELLDERFAENLSLAFVARCVGVHRVYLASSFRRYYRQSIGEYLRQRRVEFACHKIRTSNDPLVEIALAAGFANQSHFTHAFKRMTGMSPSKYRAAWRSP